MCPVSRCTSYSTRALETGESKLWFLLVGVNQYQDEGLPSLRFSAFDCQGLAEALAEATQNFPKTELLSHHDFTAQVPTLSTVRSSLKQIVSAATSQDTILFYFSGHGMLEPSNQQVVLCLSDTQKDNLLDTGLGLQEVLQLLGNCAARKQMVWLDACHSGGMTLLGARGEETQPLPNPTSELVKVLRQRAAQSKGFYALLSCDQAQQSWEFPELGHGVFSYYLIKGLRGEAADPEGIIDADGIYRYVYRKTLKYIDKTNQHLRLVNQQKRRDGENRLYQEYPLQTPKRIVEGVGELILGLKLSGSESKHPQQPLAIDESIGDRSAVPTTATGYPTTSHSELTLEWFEAGHLKTSTIRDKQRSKNPGTFRIGRDPVKCDLVLSDLTVSGLHVEIWFNPHQQCFYLRNLRESNPPLIDGQPFPTGEVALKQGNSLRLGQLDLTISAIKTGGYISTVAPTITPPVQILEHNPDLVTSGNKSGSLDLQPSRTSVSTSTKRLTLILGLSIVTFIGAVVGYVFLQRQSPQGSSALPSTVEADGSPLLSTNPVKITGSPTTNSNIPVKIERSPTTDTKIPSKIERSPTTSDSNSTTNPVKQITSPKNLSKQPHPVTTNSLPTEASNNKTHPVTTKQSITTPDFTTDAATTKASPTLDANLNLITTEASPMPIDSNPVTPEASPPLESNPSSTTEASPTLESNPNRTATDSLTNPAIPSPSPMDSDAGL